MKDIKLSLAIMLGASVMAFMHFALNSGILPVDTVHYGQRLAVSFYIASIVGACAAYRYGKEPHYTQGIDTFVFVFLGTSLSIFAYLVISWLLMKPQL